MKKKSKRNSIKKFKDDYMMKYTNQTPKVKETKTITFRLVPFLLCLILMFSLTIFTAYLSLAKDYSKNDAPRETPKIEKYLKEVCESPSLISYFSFSTKNNISTLNIYKEKKKNDSEAYSYFYNIDTTLENIYLNMTNNQFNSTVTKFGEIDLVYINTNTTFTLLSDQKIIFSVILLLEP